MDRFDTDHRYDLGPFSGLSLFGICSVDAVANFEDPFHAAIADVIYIDLMPCGMTMIGVGDDWRKFVLGVMGFEPFSVP